MSLSRIIVPTPNFNAPMPAGMTPGRRHKKCGIPAPTVPNASRQDVYMTLLSAPLAKRSSPTCSKTRLHRHSPAKPGYSGTGRWSTGGKRTTWTPSWIKIASRLCHMYDLWQVVRTKPQVLKYSIHLYLGLIWLFFLVLTKGYSLFLLTAKFLTCLHLYSEQVIRVVGRYNTIGKWIHCFDETVNDNHGPVNANKLNQ